MTIVFWTRLMWKRWTVLLVMLLLFVSTLPLAAAASPKSSYPTAGKTVFVINVSSTPRSADVGTTVVTTVAVSYEPKGYERAEVSDPVTLSPETISFRWVSSAGEKVVENAPVVPTLAGVYEYTQTVRDDFPTGTVTISVVANSCSDGQGNSGPPTDVDSRSTTFENDNSVVQISATVQQAATQDLLTVYGIPIVTAIVVIVAALLLVLRARKKKT